MTDVNEAINNQQGVAELRNAAGSIKAWIGVIGGVLTALSLVQTIFAGIEQRNLSAIQQRLTAATEEYELTEKIATKCSSLNPSDQNFYIVMTKLLEQPSEFKKDLVATGIDVDSLLKSCDQFVQGVRNSTNTPMKLPKSDGVAPRWVYLGTYDSKQNKWLTGYVAFADNSSSNLINPLDFESGASVQLTTSVTSSLLKVREGDLVKDSPVFPKEVGTLSRGEKVTVVEVKQWWRNSGNWWGRLGESKS